MPFLFILSGLVMIVSATRGTNQQLLTLLKSDFTGKNNFIYWMLSILLIGAVGYIPDLKPVSRAFLVLVVIVLILKNGGVFTEFSKAIGTTQTANTTATTGTASTLTQQSGATALQLVEY
jgi:hypothetical protein